MNQFGCNYKMFSIVFVITCAFIVINLAQRTPMIAYISPQQIKDIGGTVELSCSVQYSQEYPVLWTKIDKNKITEPVPISTGTTPIIRDSRFSLRYDIASSTYTLQIKDIQETDGGYYSCQVLISLNNKISAEVELQVRKPPIIFDNSTRSLLIQEGHAIKLECYAGGYPQPKVSWRRENNAILPTGGSVYRGNTLKIPTIRKEDRGTYYCVADNGVGKSIRRNVAIDVEFPPAVFARKARVEQAVGYDADLECRIEAYPAPDIVWIKDDTQVSKNRHYDITYHATAEEFTDTTVRVITVEERQYGRYICKATNKLGTSEATVDLYESSDPVCPPACKGYANMGISLLCNINITCLALLFSVVCKFIL